MRTVPPILTRNPKPMCRLNPLEAASVCAAHMGGEARLKALVCKVRRTLHSPKRWQIRIEHQIRVPQPRTRSSDQTRLQVLGHAKRHSLQHALLAGLPFKGCVTTNFDGASNVAWLARHWCARTS